MPPSYRFGYLHQRQPNGPWRVMFQPDPTRKKKVSLPIASFRDSGDDYPPKWATANINVSFTIGSKDGKALLDGLKKPINYAVDVHLVEPDVVK